MDNIEFKLDKMRALLGRLGNPQSHFRSVHVAGTNGKGSTCSFLSAILSQHSYKVGLHTSPHLFSFAERMRINGQEGSEEWIIGACNRMRDFILELGPSFFEASMAMSFLYFKEMDVDIAIVEVGLGGRLDASNVLEPELALITQIDLDHTKILGDTKVEIAKEKAGIIKKDVPIVTADSDPEVITTIRNIANSVGATFLHLSDLVSIDRKESGVLFKSKQKYSEVTLGLKGKHQASNAALALAGAELILGKLIPDQVHKGLENVIALSGLRARCEIVSESPFIVVDVAHNPQALSAGLEWFFNNRSNNGRSFLLLGFSSDKDIEGMLAIVKRSNVTVVPVQSKTKRGMSQSSVIGLCEQLEIETQVFGIGVADSVTKCMKHCAANDSLYIGGSHYVVGEIPKTLMTKTS